MKRILALILTVTALMAFPLSARAEEKQKIDLSGMSYEELVELKDQINLAIWQSDEWQEVEVPQGVWKVGEDIPEGKWTVKALPEKITLIRVGNKVENGGTEVSTESYATIYDPNGRYFEEGETVSDWSIKLSKGQYVQIDMGSAVFTPYAGKPSLGFKK